MERKMDNNKDTKKWENEIPEQVKNQVDESMLHEDEVPIEEEELEMEEEKGPERSSEELYKLLNIQREELERMKQLNQEKEKMMLELLKNKSQGKGYDEEDDYEGQSMRRHPSMSYFEDEFGDDYAKNLESFVRDEIKRQISSFSEKNDKMNKDFEHMRNDYSHTKQQLLAKELQEMEFEKWNQDPGFLAYLDDNEVGELSYRDIAQHAINTGNIRSLGKMIEAYKSTLPEGARPKGAQPRGPQSKVGQPKGPQAHGAQAQRGGYPQDEVVYPKKRKGQRQTPQGPSYEEYIKATQDFTKGLIDYDEAMKIINSYMRTLN